MEKNGTITIRQLAEKVGVDRSVVARTVRMNSLAPDIVGVILDDKKPDAFNLESLREAIPPSWQEQREKWGFNPSPDVPLPPPPSA